MKIMPKTRLGKWSGGLFAVFFLVYALAQLLIAIEQRGGNTIFDNLILSIPILIAGIVSIVSSSVTGFISIIKYKERSVIVFFTSVIGLFLILIFLFGGMLFPY